MAARQLEEPLNIGDKFAAAVALPRQTAAEAELAAEADGDDGADIECQSVPRGAQFCLCRIVPVPISAKGHMTWESAVAPFRQWRRLTPNAY